MSAAPDDVDPAAWRRVMHEDVPEPGTEGRPLTSAQRNTVADAMRCTWPGCGDPVTGGGAGRGWVLVRIVGSGDPARRYHSGSCASKGIAHVELGNHRTAVPAPAATVTPIRPPASTLPPGRKRATSALRTSADQQWRDLLAALGKGAPDVRAWCAANGVDLPARGPIPQPARDAFIEAHR